MSYNIKEISELMFFYVDEKEKCRKKGAGFAATVMNIAVLESLLLLMCFVFKDRVRKTEIYKNLNKGKGRLAKRKRGKFLELRLSDLIGISKELGWIEGLEKNNTEELNHLIADSKKTRNLIHPGFALKERDIYNKKDKHYDKSYRSVSLTIDNCLVELYNSIINDSFGFKITKSMSKQKLAVMHDSLEKTVKARTKDI